MSLISVIIPVYNTEKFLKQSINSVLNQTYQNFEVFLIDDGSTDSCPRICDEYSAKDKRITTIHTSNRGLSAARNTALDKCNGEYICFLDSDDYMEPTFLSKMLIAIQSGNYDFACCNFDRVDKNGNFFDFIGHSPTTEITYTSDVLNSFLGSDYYSPYAWNKLYKRKLFENIRYVEGMNYEDNDVLIRILKISNGIIIIPDLLFHYRKRKSSITTKLETEFDVKSFDMMESFYICAQELKGTRWEKEYFMKNYNAFCMYWYYSKRYNKTDKRSARKLLLKICNPKNKYINYKLFTPEEKIRCLIRYLYYALIKK